MPNSLAITCISGFSQKLNSDPLNGTEVMANKVKALCDDRIAVYCLEWKANVGRHAKMLVEKHPESIHIIEGYSFGAKTAQWLCAEIIRRGGHVYAFFSVDGVSYIKVPFLDIGLAWVPWLDIRVHDKVACRPYAFEQPNNEPNADAIWWRKQRVLMTSLIHDKHATIDDDPRVHDAFLNLIGRTLNA